MALDLAKVAAHQAAAKAKGGSFESVTFFRPKEGTSKIRIVPDWDLSGPYSGLFWREVHQHWNVNPEQRGPVLCNRLTPHMESKDCPVCEFIDKMKNNKSDPEVQALLKDLRAQQAYLIPIVDLSNPTYTQQDLHMFVERAGTIEPPFAVGDTKIQVFSASAKVHADILDLIIQNNMDITDPATGRDIFIKKVPAKGPNDFTRYTVSPGLNATPSPVKPGAKIPDLRGVTRVFSAEESRALLTSGPAGDFALLKAGNKVATGTALLTAAADLTSQGDDKLPDSYLGTDAVDDDEDGDALAAEMQAALRG